MSFRPATRDTSIKPRTQQRDGNAIPHEMVPSSNARMVFANCDTGWLRVNG